MKRIYYHVIEDAGYGNIGCHGFYETLSEAELEVKRRQEYFPSLNFYVFSSYSKKEPEFITV